MTLVYGQARCKIGYRQQYLNVPGETSLNMYLMRALCPGGILAGVSLNRPKHSISVRLAVRMKAEKCFSRFKLNVDGDAQILF